MTTHLGAWEDWDAVERLLVGRPLYMEVSLSIGYMPDAQARRLPLERPGRGEARALLGRLALGAERERKILRENALRLLGGSA